MRGSSHAGPGVAPPELPDPELLAAVAQHTRKPPLPTQTRRAPNARRTAEGRQIAVLDRHPVMRRRDHPTPRAADQISAGLDADHHLRLGLLDLEHPEPGQAEHRLGNASSVTHRQGSPHRRSLREAATMTGIPDTYPARPATPSPHSNAKGRFALRRRPGDLSEREQ